ncbi:MAG: cell division protein FtsL [Rhodobacteraceae bacterium]|nr:cell division protein FtsL [Paracoccaceae bacterium]
MKTFLYTLAALAVMGLAFWAYSENYRTQESIAKVERLHSDIGAARARVAVLKAEWAYLNRPDRLRDLAELNFERLELFPVTPEQFGVINQVAFPQPEELRIVNPVEVMERSQ